jgi:hypothetical protein
MNTQQFIEDAIAGGYETWDSEKYDYENWIKGDVSYVLLDPEAWKAVGKTRGVV